jgi:hypothetical protein
MTSLAGLIKEQTSIASELDQLYSNFNTTEEIQEKIEMFLEISKKWKDFRAKHEVLISYQNEKIIQEQYTFFESINIKNEHILQQMNSLVSIIKQNQRDSFEEIGRMYTNFKKDSQVRKTQTYLNSKLQLLDQNWVKCTQRNAVLISIANKDDTYFKERAFDNIKSVYNTFKTDILKGESNDTSELARIKKELENLKAHLKTKTEQTQENRVKTIEVKIEKFFKFMEKLKTSIPTSNRTTVVKQQIEINSKWKDIEDIDDEIWANKEESADMTAYIALHTLVENQFDDISREITDKMEEFEHGQHQQNLKLSPVTIPKFGGNIKEWGPFHDAFQNIVNKSKISIVEKFHYLKNHLQGDALKIIAHLSLTEDNYEQAYNLIRERYENRRNLTTSYIETILSIKPVTYKSAESIINMYDVLRECMHALNNQGCKTNEWSELLVTLMVKKLDFFTMKQFEETLSNPKELPTIQELLEFLKMRYQIASQTYKTQTIQAGQRHLYHTTVISCRYCRKNHNITTCGDFKALKVVQRNNFVHKIQLCRKCLDQHKSPTCSTTLRCDICQGKHNTLLHTNNKSESNPHSQVSKTKTTTTHHSSESGKSKIICLPTALIQATTPDGRKEFLRALIDQGSQATFITESAVQKLRLRKKKVYTEIFGMGSSSAGVAQSQVKLQLKPRFPSKFSIQIEALVLPKLTNLLPESEFAYNHSWDNLVLADPTLNKPGLVDMLIGADYVGDIIKNNLRQSSSGTLYQETEFGWMLSGPIAAKNTDKITTMISRITVKDLSNQLEKFWEIENMDDAIKEDDDVENQYKKTVQRSSDGRYVVKIPFKKDMKLGSSRDQALARFLNLEKKLENDVNLKKQYTKFINEYVSLGHMEKVRNADGAHYLPHHAVLKEDSTTTKLRVVFDGSAKTTNGISLNESMHVGPKILNDLTELILRWRTHAVVFIADVEKMYRQINIHPDHQKFQRILWRNNKSEPMSEYALKTVTYGTAAAPFLAIRTLKQLAKDEEIQHPEASQILSNDFYVDDCLSGCRTKAEAKHIVNDLNLLLSKGGMTLRKWTSNDPEILEKLPSSLKRNEGIEFHEEEFQSVKTLGICWDPEKDAFHFKVNYIADKCTKRYILSTIAKIYDPLGWLAPTIIIAKMFMQDLWSLKVTWDEELPLNDIQRWKKFANELEALTTISIPRWIHYTEGDVALIGFCDASEKAFAAVIYSRTTDDKGNVTVTLLTAKTRVAPVKNHQTIPRLELCGALLLAELMNKVTKALKVPTTRHLFCDSTIALAWITQDKKRSDIFITNRVNKIRSLTSTDQWKYVSTKENPADCASRGITPANLSTFLLWWNGPEWLKEIESKWPNTTVQAHDYEEQNFSKMTCTVTTKKPTTSDVYARFSNYQKLVRTVAYCIRFLKNSRIVTSERVIGSLTIDELQDAQNRIVKIVQQEGFAEEIANLNSHKPLSIRSKILNLNPFVDQNGILRVGGRLKLAKISEDQKHQILLPKDHHVTQLIVSYIHNKTNHGGGQLTLNSLRATYWIVNGRSLVNAIIQKCVRCFRFKTNNIQHQLMGNLPATRITPAPPFSTAGVDFAGPVKTRVSAGRGVKTQKSYIAVFVCMVTKAIHLELVSSLSTDAFLAAYNRFTSRRGHCTDIYSDNGTNFVGADNTLKHEFREAIKAATNKVAELIANDKTQWHFIPPSAPHFGGLWEAGVKSVKRHLTRVLGETTLSFEEFNTVLCKVEACVNSRPITPLSNDPNDLEALTPGHFLIGRPLLASPHKMIDEQIPYKRWKLVKKLEQDLWQRWSSEYLSNLQLRTKWTKETVNIAVGELVLIKDDNLPPLKWAMGRVVAIHEGRDEKVRVVVLKTASNQEKKRPITKICRLPISYEQPLAPTAQSSNNTMNRQIQPPTSGTRVHTTTSNQVSIVRNTARTWMRNPVQENLQTLVKEVSKRRLYGKTLHKPSNESTSKLTEDKEAVTPRTQSCKRRKIMPCSWAKTILYDNTIRNVETTNEVDTKMPEEAIRRVLSEPPHSASKNHITTMANIQQWGREHVQSETEQP